MVDVNSEFYDRAFEELASHDHGSLGRRYVAYLRFKNISNYILKGNFERYLDIGCGTGQYCQLFSRIFDEVFGSDISEESIFKAQKNRDKGIKFMKQDITRLTYESDFFSVITSINTIEHLNNPEIAVNELIRVTKPGGQIFIMVPNKGSYLIRVLEKFFKKHLIRGYFLKSSDKSDSHPIHIDYTRHSFEKIINNSNAKRYKFLVDSNFFPRFLRHYSLHSKELRVLEKWVKYLPFISKDVSSILVMITK